MSAQITVMKFGGTSLEDGQAFERVAHIVSSNLKENPVVVVASAMSGMTDALISSFQKAVKGETFEALHNLDHQFERHLKVTRALGATASEKMLAVIENSRREINQLLGDASTSRHTPAQGLDAMASQGERLSANLLTIVLEQHGIPASYVDARRCIITNEDYGSARPLPEETRRQTRAELQPLLAAKRVPVLGGFIAAARSGVTTTLGRGSSDYSATLFSAALGARETQIWTDVDGVMTADPALVSSACTVSQLSYEEAAELARLGARVLHSKMMEPIIQHKIPIRILNSRAPERSGTTICAAAETVTSEVKAIAHKTNLTRIDITSRPAFVANGFLGAVRNIFERGHIQMQIVAATDVGISFVCDEAGALPSLVEELQRIGLVETKGQRAIVSCVGEGLQSVGKLGKLHNILSKIDPAISWKNPSSLTLLSTVDAELVGRIVRQVHQGLFERDLR